MTWSVYQITCLPSGCVYTGRSTDPDGAWKRHSWKLRDSSHGNADLQASWDFHYPSDFAFRVVASGLDRAAADRLVEQLVIGAACEGLALRYSIGDKPDFRGRRHTEETKRRIAETSRGLVRSHRRRVVVYGKAYDSVTAAGRGVGLALGSVQYRLKSPAWPEYYYEVAS